MKNLKEQTFFKSYNFVYNLTIPNVKVDLTHINLINLILSYQSNGKSLHQKYENLANLFCVSKRKIQNTITELRNASIINVMTKKLGKQKGSTSTITINIDSLNKYCPDVKIKENKDENTKEEQPSKKYTINDKVSCYQLLKQLGISGADAINIKINTNINEDNINIKNFIKMIKEQKRLQKMSTYNGPLLQTKHIDKLKELIEVK